jgi:hypothetical protein
MTAEVEIYQPRATVAVTERDVVDGWVEVVTKIAKLADMIADTDFVPKALRNKPAAIAACMLTGREIGVGPMLSMKVIHMVNGSPSLAAEYKRARALERSHEIVYEETTTTRCVVRGRRKGEDSWLTVTWHIDDAKRAKLLGKDVWQQHPRRMLEARATGELCDLKFPDCSWGLPTTEVLEDGSDTAGAISNGTVPAIEAPRTAQRRQRAAPEDPTAAPGARRSATTTGPAAAAPGAASSSQTANGRPATPSADAGLPPLPGEDEPDPTPGPRQATGSPPSTSAAGEPQPPFDPDQHGSATRGKGGQLTALWTILNEVYEFPGDDTGKKQARKTVEQIIGRDLDGGTTGDLSSNEASGVIDTLSRCRHAAEKEGVTPREQLIVLLTASDKATGQQQPEDGNHG